MYPLSQGHSQVYCCSTDGSSPVEHASTLQQYYDSQHHQQVVMMANTRTPAGMSFGQYNNNRSALHSANYPPGPTFQPNRSHPCQIPCQQTQIGNSSYPQSAPNQQFMPVQQSRVLVPPSSMPHTNAIQLGYYHQESTPLQRFPQNSVVYRPQQLCGSHGDSMANRQMQPVTVALTTSSQQFSSQFQNAGYPLHTARIPPTAPHFQMYSNTPQTHYLPQSQSYRTAPTILPSPPIDGQVVFSGKSAQFPSRHYEKNIQTIPQNIAPSSQTTSYLMSPPPIAASSSTLPANMPIASSPLKRRSSSTSSTAQLGFEGSGIAECHELSSAPKMCRFIGDENIGSFLDSVPDLNDPNNKKELNNKICERSSQNSDIQQTISQQQPLSVEHCKESQPGSASSFVKGSPKTPLSPFDNEELIMSLESNRQNGQNCLKTKLQRTAAQEEQQNCANDKVLMQLIKEMGLEHLDDLPQLEDLDSVFVEDNNNLNQAINGLLSVADSLTAVY